MPPALAAVLAVIPGLLNWAWGRSLVRSPEDPTLPERVQAWRQRSVAGFATGAALLIVLLPREAPWAVPLLVFASLAGGFPIRRSLFDERWDFIAYLAHLARVTVGIAGFWLLLLFAPALVAWARPHTWPAAAMLALVLAAWGLAYPQVLLWVTGGTPLGRQDLEERFAAISERSTALPPRLWRVGPREGRWANAFALPSTRTPAVVFTRAFVELFDTDEAAAVFAHELAHLEHFDVRRVRRLALLQNLAVLLGTLGAAVALERFEGATVIIILGWPLFLLSAALVAVVRRRAHEAESDRRAVELCGDPQALARALVKLHALALLPRRLAGEEEQRATHPSLAHRLRAIEKLDRAAGASATGDTGAPLGTSSAPEGPRTTVLAGTEPGTWVILGAGRAHWLEGVPEGTPREAGALQAAALRVRSLAFSELVELRLQPRRRDHVLVAGDRTGAAWSLPLATGEVARAHEALDAVDRHLAPPSAARPERRVLGALVACTGAIMALLAWSAAALPALLATVVTHPGPLAAFGASGLVAGIFALGSGGSQGSAFDPQLAPLANVGLAVCALAALWIARTTAWRERARRTRTAPWVASGLAFLALVFLVGPLTGLMMGGLLRGHVAARDHPGGAILLVAAMGALLVVPRRWGRVAAVGVGIFAAATFFLGSSAFTSLFVRDPFLARGGTPGASTTIRPPLIDERALPAASGQLELSPSGLSWAIRQFEVGNAEEPPVHQMVVGSESGAEHEYAASDIVLLDDERLLALFQEGDRPAVELRPHDVTAPALWRVELEPLLEGAELSAERVTGRWRVSGTHRGSGDLVRISGGRDGSYVVDRWDPGPEGAVWVLGDGPAALGIAPPHPDAAGELWETGLADEDSPALWWLLAGHGGIGLGGRFLSLDAAGTRELFATHFHVQCDAPPPGGVELLCRASDGSRTTLWRVDPADGARSPVGRLDGFAWPARPQPGGWVLLVNAGSRQQLYRLDAGRLVRLDVGPTPPWIQAAAGYEGGVGVLVSDVGQRPRLRRFALP